MAQPSTMDIITEIQQIRDLFCASKDSLVASYSSWNKDKDARITLFSKCTNVLNDAQLGLVFAQFHLTQQQWWNSIAKENIPNSAKQKYIDEFVMFTKVGFLQFTFSSIESSFRLFVKSIDSTACSNGTAEFKSIYSFLLTKLNLQKWEPLLDLFRCIRNTIHNNGVYFHRLGNNETITYTGVNYSFVVGLPVDFVNWEFLINMLKDIHDMLCEVVTHSDVARIPSIIDPFS